MTLTDRIVEAVENHQGYSSVENDLSGTPLREVIAEVVAEHERRSADLCRQ